jgi:hypothetical protein
MTAVAMLQALLFGLLLAATPPWSDDLEESLWDLHITPLDAEPAPAFTSKRLPENGFPCLPCAAG